VLNEGVGDIKPLLSQGLARPTAAPTADSSKNVRSAASYYQSPAHARTVSALSVMGVMFGSLKEQHADHIVLSDSTRIRLADGLVLDQFGSGTRVTITYRRDRGGEMIVESIQRSAMPKVRPDHLP